MFPAAYDSVIAVTATDADDLKAYFSPIGPEVELAAPGLNIQSTIRGGGYDFLSGTSQASPHVAGTAALLLSSPDLVDLNLDGMIDNLDVRLALHGTAIDLGDLGKDEIYGFGLVNATSASLPGEVLSFSLTSTTGHQSNDAETVYLAGIPYEITIVNNNLSNVDVDVLEGGTRLKDLSAKYHFNNKKPQGVTFSIDATGTRYNVMFTPHGKSGSSADITISVK